MGQKKKKSKAAPATVPESAAAKKAEPGSVKKAEAGAVKKPEKAGKAEKRQGRTLSHALSDNRALAILCAVFLLAVFCVFPVVYHDFYYDILEFKCISYTVMSLVFLGCAAVLIGCWAFRDVQSFGGREAGKLVDAAVPWHWGRQPVYIRFLLVFWLLVISSTICSEWRQEAWTGSQGRYSGLMMISLYVLTTLLVAAYGEVRRWFLDAFLVVSLFVGIFGITDYFRMDLLGFKSMEVGNPAADIFTSTMGNVNTYTGFLALPVGVAAALFAVETVWWRRMLYFAATFVLYLALFTGQSDNAYLALGALFCGLPFFMWKSRKGLALYILLIANFAAAVLVAGFWKTGYADTVIWYSGVIDVLMKIPFAKGITAILWIAGIGLLVLDRQKGTGEKKDGFSENEVPSMEPDGADRAAEGEESFFRLLRRGWGIFLIVCLLAVVFVLLDANAGGHPERYEAVHNYVVFSDDWGVQRGFAWRIGWQEYKELPFFRMVLGSGPDTYGLLTESHWQEGIDKYGFYYESAHNEYFQYFVTIGPFATLAYVGFLVTALLRMAKCSAEKPWLLAPCMAILCYAAQAVVNISIPIAAAAMWAMMALGLAGSRNK